MKKVWIIFVLIGLLGACKSSTEKKEIGQKQPVQKEQIHIKKGDVVIEKYANGENRTVQKFEKVDGQLQPVYEKIYYEDGSLSKEGPLKENRREGHWKSYYRDGTLWSEGDFVKGMAQGVTITYYANGKKRYEGQFKDGIKSGIWKFWDDKGNFVKDVTYIPQSETKKKKK